MASAIYILLSSAAYTVEIDSVPRYAVKQVFRSGTTAAEPYVTLIPAAVRIYLQRPAAQNGTMCVSCLLSFLGNYIRSCLPWGSQVGLPCLLEVYLGPG
jgi:hypothetical protein